MWFWREITPFFSFILLMNASSELNCCRFGFVVVVGLCRQRKMPVCALDTQCFHEPVAIICTACTHRLCVYRPEHQPTRSTPRCCTHPWCSATAGRAMKRQHQHRSLLSVGEAAGSCNSRIVGRLKLIAWNKQFVRSVVWLQGTVWFFFPLWSQIWFRWPKGEVYEWKRFLSNTVSVRVLL